MFGFFKSNEIGNSITKNETDSKETFKTLRLKSSEIYDKNLQKLLFENEKVSLVVGFISPHLNFSDISRKIKDFFSYDTKVILCSTAGELCTFSAGESTNGLYQDTNGSWDDIVLSSFSSFMIDKVHIESIELGKVEDITVDEKVSHIQRKVESIRVPFDLNSNDTLAYTLIDGLSAAENFFMEAVYNSAKFPILFVGGSAGGKLDFKNTYIFDGSKTVQNHAVVAFIKFSKNVKFGEFKSQNFTKTEKVFYIVEFCRSVMRSFQM